MEQEDNHPVETFLEAIMATIGALFVSGAVITLIGMAIWGAARLMGGL